MGKVDAVEFDSRMNEQLRNATLGNLKACNTC
jgi:hypothetical protein